MFGAIDVAVELRLHHVRREHRDEIGALHRLGGIDDFQSIGLRLQRCRTAFAQADDDIESRIAQVQRMRAALAAVAEHGDAGVLQRLQFVGHCRFLHK